MPAPLAALAAAKYTPEADRLAATRLCVTYRVQMRCGADSVVAHTADISASGLFLEMRQALPLASVVHLSFTVTGSGGAREPVEVEGEVVRVVSAAEAAAAWKLPGVGVTFTRFLWGGEAFARDLAQRIGGGRPHALALVRRGRGSRAAMGIPVYWGHEGKQREAGYLTNLSAAGAFFLEGRGTVPAGATIHVWFEVPVDGEAKPVRAVARVLRVAAGDAGGAAGMGISLETSPLDQATLQAFLDRRREGVRWEEGLERTHPTRLDELFLAAAADWEANGIVAAGAPPGAPRAAAAATAAHPAGQGTPPSRATTTPRVGAAPPATATERRHALGRGLKLASLAAAAFFCLFVGLVLHLL